jgi:hypothetical protein
LQQVVNPLRVKRVQASIESLLPVHDPDVSRNFFESSNRVKESIACLSIIIGCMRSASFQFAAEDLRMEEELATLAAE